MGCEVSEENYNCPHCGSEPLWISGGYPTPSGKALLKRRQCGSLIDPLYPENEERSELCREREKVQNLWDELHSITDCLGAGLPNLDPDSGCTPGHLVLGLKRENQKLRSELASLKEAQL